MKSTAIVCAIAAASLGFSSLSFAQANDWRGPRAEPQVQQQAPRQAGPRDQPRYEGRMDHREDRRADRHCHGPDCAHRAQPLKQPRPG